MDPIFGGLIAGGASLLGSIFGTSQNNQNSLQMQQQAEAYNTQMSNTAYQRASADMKAAGLNPMIMAGGGGGASTPTIQPAQLQSAAQGIGPAVNQALATAMQARTANAAVDNLVAQNAQIQADSKLKDTQIALNQGPIWTKTDAEATDIYEQARLRNAALPTVVNEALKASNEAEFRSTPAGKLLDQAGLGGRQVSSVLSPISNLVSSARGAVGAYNDATGSWQ